MMRRWGIGILVSRLRGVHRRRNIGKRVQERKVVRLALVGGREAGPGNGARRFPESIMLPERRTDVEESVARVTIEDTKTKVTRLRLDIEGLRNRRVRGGKKCSVRDGRQVRRCLQRLPRVTERGDQLRTRTRRIEVQSAEQLFDVLRRASESVYARIYAAMGNLQSVPRTESPSCGRRRWRRHFCACGGLKHGPRRRPRRCSGRS